MIAAGQQPPRRTGRGRGVCAGLASAGLASASGLLLAGLVACAGQGDQAAKGDGDAIASGDAIVKTSELGPVKATVTLAPRAPRLGDAMTLVLEVEAAPGVSVDMPSFGEALGRFQITRYVPRETIRDGKWLASQTYTLQAPMSGRQRIPPLAIDFVDERQGQAQSTNTSAGGPDSTAPGDKNDKNPASDKDRSKELLTEEIAIDIASVSPDGAVADKLGEPAGDLAPDRPLVQSVWLWLGVVLALFGAGAGGYFYREWRRAARTRTRVSAYDQAMARLAELERRGLPGEGVVDAWYVELSSIIRRYLEDRYNLRAPELTTEEFLYIAQRSGQLSAGHRDLLARFLTGCDRVKFARYAPGDEESRQALAAARQFLRETRLEPASPGAAAEQGTSATAPPSGGGEATDPAEERS